MKPSRICSVAFQMTAFVCEREPEKKNFTCKSGHFNCDDSTCILTIYVCDNVIDCLNGEDEAICEEKNSTTGSFLGSLSISSAMIPCTRSNNYFNNEELIAHVHAHSVCDGIHDCTIINEELCNYGVVQPIHITRNNILHINDVGRNYEDLIINQQMLASMLHYTLNDVAKIINMNKSSSALNTLFKTGLLFLEKVELEGMKRNGYKNYTGEMISNLTLPCPEQKSAYTIHEY